ncbi:MAG: hypothetical protein M9927_06335 [Anaerolineae bacterium]|nr:hypothetical protein [Anaerolineae bacterium]
MRKHLFLVVLGAAFALLSGLFVLMSHGSVLPVHAASGPATTFTIAPGDAERVPLDRNDGVCTLAEAVEAANDQGVSNPPLNDCGSGSPGLNIIELQAGDYNLTAQVAVINGGNTATFNVVTPIIVRGVTSDTTTIRRDPSSQDQFRFFHVGSNGFLTLENLGLAGGYANGGTGGGAAYVSPNGTMLVTRTQMLSNTARYGGALYNGGSTTVIDSAFLGNSASEDDASQGGAIYATNNMTVTASSITANESTDSGGGIYVSGTGSGAFWISLSNISTNVANSDVANGGSGGGIYHSSGVVTSTLNSITLNAALPSVPIGHGSAVAEGGGVYAADKMNLFFTLVDGNAAESGAGLFNSPAASTTVTSTLFIGNLASATGAGIANRGALDLYNAILWANVAEGNGGGLYNETLSGASANVRNSTIVQNQSLAARRRRSSTSTGSNAWTALSNVTVASNNANGDGGGIANGNDGQIVVASSTLANNTAGGNGGGIASSDPITNHVRIRNTILTGNNGGNVETTENCSGALTSQGYNLDSGTGCAFVEPGDISDGNAALDSLAPADPLQVLQGNITPAYDLLPDSQAINAANPTACYDARNVNNNGMPLETDQWGEARVKQLRCDIGAIETDNTPTAVTLTGLVASSPTHTALPAGLVAAFALLALLAAIAGARRLVSPMK